MNIQTDASPQAMAESASNGVASAGNQGTWEPPPSGYPKEIFVSPVDEKFLCGHCENILRQPLQSQCGHRFCSGCRLRMLQLPQPIICQECIKDEQPEESSILKLDSMFDDKAAIREMRKIQCKCINPGCDWTGIFQEYSNNHETSCDKKKVACPLCGSLISQNKLEEHKSSNCPKRLVKCVYCHQEMIFEQLEKHRSKCPQKPVKCDKCTAQVPRNEIVKHKERDCVHREVVCPVPDCHKKMSKEHFPAHLNDSPKSAQRHLQYLFDRISQLEQEMSQLTLPTSGASRGHEGQGRGASSASGGAESSAALQAGRTPGGQVTEDASAGAQGAESSDQRVTDTLKLHEDLMSVLHGEILRCIRQVEALTTSRHRENFREVNTRLQNVERAMGVMEIRLRELQPAAGPSAGAMSPTTAGTLVEDSGNGTATWCIPAFSQVRRAALNGVQQFVDSPPFTTGSLGYKLRLRIFPDGEGPTKKKAISAFVQLMPGPCDDLLHWPFEADIHFALIDRKDFTHHKKASIHSPSSEVSCRKPSRTPNPNQPHGQPGVGVNTLISLQDMFDDISRYNLDDVLYLRCMVVLRGVNIQTRLRGLDPRKGSPSERPSERQRVK